MNIISRIRLLLTDTLLGVDDVAGIGKFNLRLRQGYRLVYYTMMGLNYHRTFVESAALTLFTLFALVPLLALTLIILDSIGLMQPIITSLYSTFSEWRYLLDTILDTAASAADNIPNGLFTIIGIFALFGALFTVFNRVEASFNHIWGIRRRRRLLRRYITYLITALVAPIIWGVTTSVSYDVLAWMGLTKEINDLLAALISLGIAAIATTLLYKYLPYTAVGWRNALKAGITTGILLAVWQWGYVHIQEYMTSYNILYGSFAAIPFFIIWIHISWQIILFGCELCYVWQHGERYESVDRRRRATRPQEQSLSVVVVGSGNVAEAFALRLSKIESIELRQIYARNPVRGRDIATMASTEWGDNPHDIAAADIYIIAVSDKAVEEVAHSLRLPEDAVVVHTAGSVPLTALPKRGGRRGILYAFQTFTQGRRVRLDNVPLFIEADSEQTHARLLELASLLSTQVEYADSERRRKIHLAGVLVNNFVNSLYAAGSDVVDGEGLSFDILKPLIMETAAKAVESGDPRTVQTGPASRGDAETCRKHIKMLGEEPELQKIYQDLTNYIWETSKKI